MTAGLWAASPEPAPVHLTSVVHADARSGKLVRSVVMNPRAIHPTVIAPRVISASLPSAPPPTGIDEVVASVAAQQSLSAHLIHAVIQVESNYNTAAISSKGALGIMQLMPATARRFGVAHVFDPVENIQGGARYLRYLLDLFQGDRVLALAAYNAGEAAVAKYNGVPPFAETQNYVVQVENHLQRLMAAEKAKQAPPVAVVPVPVRPNGPAHVQEVVDADGTVRYVSR